MADELKPCPNCGKKAGEPKKSELPTRFPYCVSGTDTITLTHMVGDTELSRALTEAFLAGRNRVFRCNE